MQDMYNKLKELVDGLTSFFEHYSDQSADELAALEEISSKLTDISAKLDTLIAK